MAVDLVALGATAALKGADVWAQGKMNKKTRKFSENMYNRQRADNLADWKMQNEYNHPSSQMERLRKAGLNANLVYGNGATTEAAQAKSADAPSWNPETPQFSPALATYQDTKMSEAQTDNLKAQNTVLTQEAILKAATTASLAANTAESQMRTRTGLFNLSQTERLADTSAEVLQQQLRKYQIENQVALNEDERRTALNASSLKEAAERILLSRSHRETNSLERNRLRLQAKGLEHDNTLKKLDINLKEKGIQPGDPLYMRALGQFLDGAQEEIKKDPVKKAWWDSFANPYGAPPKRGR